MKHFIILNAFLLLSYFSAHSESNIETTQLAQNLYKIRVYSVNIVALVGSDGVLLSDAAFDDTGDLIEAELKKLGHSHINCIINTHWHHDHCGGNKIWGERAKIIAHQNVVEKLSSHRISKYWQEEYHPFPKHALPDVTFSDFRTLNFNNEKIELLYLPNGHTDCDIIVYFKNANVLHVGDLLFSESFPAVDFENGGNVEQFAWNLQTIIEMVPPDVKIIAGHGPDFTREQLTEYRDMMINTTDCVRNEIEKGKNVAEMKKADILKNWVKWEKGKFTRDYWIEMICNCLKCYER